VLRRSVANVLADTPYKDFVVAKTRRDIGTRIIGMITKKLLLSAIAATSLLPFSLPAQELRIEMGDRPYYTHGARYWSSGTEMVWVPGHWSENRHHWVHGHYMRTHRRHDWDRRDWDHRDTETYYRR